MNRINYCKQRLNEIYNESEKILDKHMIEYKRYLLFDENNFNEKDFYKKRNYLTLISFLKYELDQIKGFELNNNKYNLSYHCYYNGFGYIYYDEKLKQYSNEQFFQILLNHIFHYLLNFTNKTKEMKQLSFLILCFDNMGLINENIIYAQSKRDSLILEYPNIKDKIILFPAINNCQKYKQYCLHITQQYISIYKKNKKTHFDVDNDIYIFSMEKRGEINGKYKFYKIYNR